MRMTFRVTRFALRAEVDGPVEKRRHESHRDGISDRSRRKAGLFESHRDGILDRTGCRDDLSESHRDGSLDRSRRKAVFFESHRDGILDRTGCRDDLSESHWDGISDGPLQSIHTVSIKTFKRNDRNRFQSKLPSRWDSNCLHCNYSDAGFPLAIPAEAETSPVIPAEAEIRSIINHPYIHFRAYLFPPVRAPHTLTGTALINPQMYTHFGASESATTRNRHA